MEVQRKLKKCSNGNCGGLFKPFTTTQKYCGYECANEGKKSREEARESKKKATNAVIRKELFELARFTFNAYIRERDKVKPCICCGRRLGAEYHAGHYYSGGGHAAVIFDEDNVHAQRSDCNTGHRVGMLDGYGVRLEAKIGSDRFELLRANAYEAKKWEIEELQRVIREYKQKRKQLINK